MAEGREAFQVGIFTEGRLVGRVRGDEVAIGVEGVGGWVQGRVAENGPLIRNDDGAARDMVAFVDVVLSDGMGEACVACLVSLRKRRGGREKGDDTHRPIVQVSNAWTP